MIFLFLQHLLSFLLDLNTVARRSDRDKNMEILLLRQQLRILQRTQPRPPRISHWEKLSLRVLAGKLTTLTNTSRVRRSQVVFPVKPEAVLK